MRTYVKENEKFKETYREEVWDAQKTAVVICDMWDQHWCKGATARVAEMAPRMNEVINKLREEGALIIHAPSSCMSSYRNSIQKKLAAAAPKFKTKIPLKGWYSLDAKIEPALPIDSSDGGCDCFPKCPDRKAWSKQIDSIEIQDGDAVTDSNEAFFLMKQQGRTNVIVMGVHTNMCVLGRPFSIRQLISQGQRVVLMRDMTDSMYNHRMTPFVSHFKGTELVVEHIEKYWCPSITSDQIIGGQPFKFRDCEKKLPDNPRILFLLGEDEFKTSQTLPEFSKECLEPLGYKTVFLSIEDKYFNQVAYKTIQDVDLVILSLSRKTFQQREMAILKNYLQNGKPLIGIRTSCYAFDPQTNNIGKTFIKWPDFDKEVLGAEYLGHYGVNESSTLKIFENAHSHKIMKDIGTLPEKDFYLYKNRISSKSVEILLEGNCRGSTEPVAWTNVYGDKKARIFYTSLGKPEDFKNNSFKKILTNAVNWTLRKD